MLVWSMMLLIEPGWAANPTAIDAEIVDGESSVYILYDDGFIQTGGNAKFYGMPSGIKAVNLLLTPTNQGYFVLDEAGNVYSYGDATVVSTRFSISNDVKYVDMEFFDIDQSPIFLLSDGTVVTAVKSKFWGQLLKDGAVDLELTNDLLGYYVLYEDGTVAYFGSAKHYGFSQSNSLRAVNLELVENGYYVTYNDGTILQFGDAVAFPFKALPTPNTVDMILTTNGYRILTADGQLHSFLQINNQGRLSWFAEINPRQTQPTNTPTRTPTPTNTPTPTRTPRPDTGYFVINQAGFTEKIIGSLPSGTSLPSSLDKGHASLFGGGLFVVLSSSTEPVLPRTIQFYSKDRATSQSHTGEIFAQLEPQRGSAFIRGIAYSEAGLYVTIEDASGVLIVLIQGEFEDASVRGFSIY